MFERACFPPRTTGRRELFRDRARLRVDLPRMGGRRITWSRSLATAPGQHTFQPTDGGYSSAASDDQFHAGTAPSNTRMGRVRFPGRGKEGSDSLGRTWCVAHPRGENPTRARLRPPANWPRKGRTRTGSRKSGRGVEPLGRGTRTRARHDREGRSPPARGAREDESVFAGFTALCVQ
ncbi:unnamed protein product [Sphagnum compactum]